MIWRLDSHWPSRLYLMRRVIKTIRNLASLEQLLGKNLRFSQA